MNKRYIPCNLCGSKDYTILFDDELKDNPPKLDYDFSQDSGKTYQIVKCCSCGLIYTNPMPSLSALYPETVDSAYFKSSKQRLRTAQVCLADILKFKEGGNLLDIGCSTGLFLDAASRHFNVEGIEVSGWARRLAGQRHKVYSRALSELSLGKRYDVITLFGVIEHFEDPAKEPSPPPLIA